MACLEGTFIWVLYYSISLFYELPSKLIIMQVLIGMM